MAKTGKELIFDAFVTRFNATANLKAVGRKLAMVPESTRPWSELEFIGFDTEDGFADDIEVHSIRITFHGKYPTIRRATTWLEEMTGAFDDYTGLSISGYTTSGVNRVPSDDGPRLEDGVWEASVEYEVWLHRDVLLPPVRGA
jgi:hypothetical protein